MTRFPTRTIGLLAAALLLRAPLAGADVVDTFHLSDAGSFGPIGVPENDIRNVVSPTWSPYQLGSIAWSGLASPTPDPDDPAVFPSWGADLGVRVTHVPSGTQADLLLGAGGEFGPGPQEFAGATRALNGLHVVPGDTFRFEFFEGLDDPFVLPDAVWHSIEFRLSDDFAPPLGTPGEGIVRLQTWGRNTFPTSEGELGAEFFRLHYGHGTGPAIVEAVLNTHASSADDLWFDSQETGEPPALDGTFQANRLDGVAAPLVQFEGQSSSAPTEGHFAVLRLSFAPGEFAGGDAVHFGLDTDGGFSGPPTGDAFAGLSPPLTLTVLFDDGTRITGDLQQIRQDVDHAAVLELDSSERTLRADLNTDGDVDGSDLLDMLLHFGQMRLATPRTGDTDGNGNVDSADIDIWREQVGRTKPADLASSASVAEPESVLLLLLLLAVCWASQLYDRLQAAAARPLTG